MVSNHLTNDQVYEIVSQNRYSFPEYKYRGRCFSGEFKNSFHLPALALPGGDLGELSILLATATSYGFEIDVDKAVGELFQLTSGNEHITSESAKLELKNCEYFQYVFRDSASYNLDADSLQRLHAQMTKIVPEFQSEFYHKRMNEHALLIFEASEGLYPQYLFQTHQGTFASKVLIFHKTLVDMRHKMLAKTLIEKGIVKLFGDLGIDYLYEIISDITELHLFETVNRIDSKIPIFSARIDQEENISIEKL